MHRFGSVCHRNDFFAMQKVKPFRGGNLPESLSAEKLRSFHSHHFAGNQPDFIWLAVLNSYFIYFLISKIY
jgi:hypothetical protein